MPTLDNAASRDCFARSPADAAPTPYVLNDFITFNIITAEVNYRIKYLRGYLAEQTRLDTPQRYNAAHLRLSWGTTKYSVFLYFVAEVIPTPRDGKFSPAQKNLKIFQKTPKVFLVAAENVYVNKVMQIYSVKSLHVKKYVNFYMNTIAFLYKM